MYKLLGVMIVTGSLTACVSSGPNERTFTPTVTEAEMAENSRQVEEIEKHSRQIAADTYFTEIEGLRILIDAANPK